MADAAAWAIRRCLRPAQASGVVSGSASSSWRHRRASSGSGLASSASNASRPPALITSSGSWPAGSSTKRSVRSGREQGKGAQVAARIAALRPGAVAVEAEDRRGIEAPQALELGFGERGADGRDDFGDAGAVEGDHVHIAFDDDQAPGGPAGGRGAVDIVESAALVEERRVGRIEIFGLAVAEDAAAKGDDAAARVADREHQPAAEAVVAVASPSSGWISRPASISLSRRACRARA